MKAVRSGGGGGCREESSEPLKTLPKAPAEGRGLPPRRSGELKVFRVAASGGSNLRKQKSLSNLSFLTDAEKKLQLGPPGTPRRTPAAPAPLSRSLSRSEHSLAPSRIPRGPYAEVKPLSKGPSTGTDDELLTSKAKAGAPPAPTAATPAQDGGKAFLKVDPELVVTVLGDLEQLLFSQMLDPESQRKRTVQNVLDLRQNLEETMSSLRGSQVSHSSLEMTCSYDSDDANPRSISSLSNRSSPISWRYGQSSPRLQAGDAPSVGGSCRSEGSPSWYMHGDRAHYSHTMPMRSPSKLSHISRLELIENLDTDEVDGKSGYMSDSDLMGKTMTEDDDITTG
ncbi:neuron navigator 1-like [Microcaecilia unicolor]|uniref:Neuron navigator 1-like n=1 Tax=Microcaecilia unicolor TaxID=1415580 RepID=A0A6P7ZW11_9AMPH|nr:neuron navigator 1-like [Microcaecilia unicolor]